MSYYTTGDKHRYDRLEQPTRALAHIFVLLDVLKPDFYFLQTVREMIRSVYAALSKVGSR